MNPKILKRRNFLNKRKSSGHRVTIGFAGIADFRSFIGQEYIAGMKKAVNDYDINFINMAGATKYSLFDDLDFTSHYVKTFSFMKAPLLDGIVTWASSMCEYLSHEKITQLFTNLQPLPMVDIGYMDIPGVPSIRIDNKSSMNQMISHLVNVHKYKKFVFIGSHISAPHHRRMELYQEELHKHGIEEIPFSVYMAETMEPKDIMGCVEELMSHYNLKEHTVDVIVTSSDIIAANVIDALDNLGVNVPSDICVTGFNNQYAGLTALSPITTVNLEYFKRGYTAVELLIDRIITPEEEIETQLIPTSLVLRQSCGCFEKSIENINSQNFSIEEEILRFNEAESESEFRKVLLSYLNYIFVNETEESKRNLVNAIFMDIYEPQNPPKILRWFQDMLQNNRKKGIVPSMDYQTMINNIRNLVFPLVRENSNQYHHLEDIFHQLRILVSVFTGYDILAQSGSSYLFNNLSNTAIDFASAKNEEQIKEVLCHQLSEMEIPGIILCLSDNMGKNLGTTNVALIHPKPEQDFGENVSFKIYDPSHISKKFFPQNRRYSMMLEILHYGDMYFGFSFMEMGNQNIAVYDGIRSLLSNALFSIYAREGRTYQKDLMISEIQIRNLLNISMEDSFAETKNGISVQEITEYLLNHINEMSNLERMAEELSVSKSSLVRQCKELTGYTVQTLHEKLKIEQAKNLLLAGSFKLSEISARLGFQNQNYFSNVFKKNTGLSPTAWVVKNHGIGNN